MVQPNGIEIEYDSRGTPNLSHKAMFTGMLAADDLVKKAVDNPVNALISGNYLAILLWGILFGILFRKANDATKAVLSDFASIVSGVVRIVIRFAPLGVLGLVYSSCTKKM